MKEAHIVAKIEEQVKKQLPGAVWLKLNDYSTTGIPDVTITYGGRTTFVEVKLLRPNETRAQFIKHFDKLQLATCRLLERQGRCLYFIVFGDSASIVRPSTLARYLENESNTDMYSIEPLGGYVDEFKASLSHLAWLARR